MKQHIKQVLISILVGAVVAFVTVFLEGALEYMQGMENNLLGGAAAAARHFTATLHQH